MAEAARSSCRPAAAPVAASASSGCSSGAGTLPGAFPLPRRCAALALLAAAALAGASTAASGRPPAGLSRLCRRQSTCVSAPALSKYDGIEAVSAKHPPANSLCSAHEAGPHHAAVAAVDAIWVGKRPWTRPLARVAVVEWNTKITPLLGVGCP